MLPRINTVNDRIRGADLFPRIRDAELKMKTFEEKWQRTKIRRAKELKLKGNLNALDQAVQEDPEPPDMFSEHVLNKDPAMSKILTYDSLYYPKAFGHEKYPPESLDRFWMSAYIDRAERDAEALKKERERDLFNSVPDYSGGSTSAQASSSASVDASEVKSKRSDTKIRNSIEQSNKISKLACDGVDELESETSLSAGLADDGYSVGSSVYNDSYPSLNSETVTKAVNDDPLLRIQKLLDKKMTGKKKPPPTLEQKLKPYNNALKAIAVAKMKKPPVVEPHSIVSLDLDRLFEHERIENEAAKRIAKVWKRYKIMPKLHFSVYAMLRAVQIQKLIRGVLCRKRVGRYFNFMTILATWTQAHIRRYLSNKYWRPYLAMEKMCAIRIQKVLRGKFGRNKWLLTRRHICATKIQAMYRGIASRTRSDIKWLNKVVTPIQCMSRKFLMKRRVAQVRNEVYPAADKIQRCFRAYYARRKVADKLFDREMSYREDVMTNLQSEEEWVQDKLEKVVKRFTKNNIKAEAEKVFMDCENKYEQIYVDQNMYLEINRQMEILSPRAITQGWFLELNKKAYVLRNELTQKKIGCLFTDLAKVLHMDDRLNRSIEEIEYISAWRSKLAKQRDHENLERRQRFYLRDLRNRRKADRREVAEEKRKWAVKFFTSDGKPDKRRRPGKPWDPSIYARPERMTYSAVDGVNLIANDIKSKALKPGSVESVNETMGKMALQTYLDQVNHYEQILNPIQNIMRQYMAPLPVLETDKRTGKINIINEGSTGRGPLEKPLSEALQSTEIVGWDLVPEHKTEYSRRTKASEEGSLWSEAIDSKSVITASSDSQQKNVFGKTNSYGLITKKELERREELAKERERVAEEQRRLEENQRQRQERVEARRRRKASQRSGGSIPWALLDELDGEKRRFESDVAYHELYHKF